MPITINGNGTLTGVSVGGLPDGIVDTDMLAANAVATAKIADNAVTDAKSGTLNGIVKAWVNFNGTGTVAIRDHYNVSSVTDNNTGTYTVNFDTDFGSVNYAAVISCGNSINTSSPRGFETVYNYQAGSVKFDCRDENGSEQDPSVASLICIGDQ